PPTKEVTVPLIGVPQTSAPGAIPEIGVTAGYPSYPASVYRDLVLAAGPTLYWRVDEVDGQDTAKDFSGNGNGGTYVASPLRSQPGGLLNDPDTSVLLDGSTQYISSSYAPFVNGSQLTFEGLAYRN